MRQKNKIRIEWDDYDLVTEEFIKAKVKASSYLQSWKQIDHSKISFNISHTKRLDSEISKYESETKRQAEVYVFYLMKYKDKATVDPLNIEQWEFYIVPTEQLNNGIKKKQNFN